MRAMTDRGHITLITGGARSGKSALAERLAARHPGPRIYIATAEPGDDEMAERIAQHQRSRGNGWRTIEAPLDLPGALAASDGQGVRLVDCLTLWLANCHGNPDMTALEKTLRQQRSPVLLVTNELGQGIVPENRLARTFRDQHGWMNQAVAEMADEVWVAISGQPLRLKPWRERLDDPI